MSITGKYYCLYEVHWLGFKSPFCIHLDRNDQSGVKSTEIWLFRQQQSILKWIILSIILLHGFDPWRCWQICGNMRLPVKRWMLRFSRIEWIDSSLEGVQACRWSNSSISWFKFGPKRCFTFCITWRVDFRWNFAASNGTYIEVISSR